MRSMLVRTVNEEDIYINPKQIETIKRDSNDLDFDTTIITFVSGNSITIRESVYDFIEELRKN